MPQSDSSTPFQDTDALVAPVEEEIPLELNDLQAAYMRKLFATYEAN